ncbi:MAG TPA: ATP-binding protein [Anaeromyxobacter sp.]|nr:ATP-binding protein [Anaeromyxobacter sp.]
MEPTCSAAAPRPPEQSRAAGCGTLSPHDACEWLESLPAIAWRTDERALIVDRNRLWFEYTGRPRETASATDWLEVIHADDRERAARAVQDAVATGGMLDCEFRVRRWDGAYRWFLARAAPVRDGAGRVTGWMGIATDIEDRRRAEEALREADRRKDEFLGVLSHELRNPLSPVASAIYILERVDPTGTQARRAREIIARQTRHLTRLVDDLLDVTRIIRGKIELRRARLDLGEVLRRTAEDHRALMDERGIRFTVELPAAPLPIDGDATRISQIAGNLLLNAAKFTHRGGAVTLRVVEGPDAHELHVKDDGTGISADLLPRVFEPFTQGPQGLARTPGGLGLGLALVKGLAELHGGGVAAYSAGPGRGAELVVTFPVAPAVGPRRALRAAAERVLDVLVVGRGQRAAELAAEVERWGHAARHAHDPGGALAAARAAPPDVVLCDLDLPGAGALTLARALRGSELGDELVLVAAGALGPDRAHVADEAGFDLHLARASDAEALRRLLGFSGPPQRSAMG